jgi:Ca-activated chloride channel family protein
MVGLVLSVLSAAALVAAALLSARRRAPALLHPLTSLAAVASQASRRRRSLAPPLLFLAALASCCVALTHPQLPLPAPRGTPVVLCLDTSASMALKDIHPSRLQAATEAARALLAALPPSTPAALVAFSTYPTVLSPLTTDRHALVRALEHAEPQFATAIGRCIVQALALLPGRPPAGELMRAAPPSPLPPGDIVVISDGGSDHGIDPVAAARLARAFGARVHTVRIASPQGFAFDPDIESEALAMRRIAEAGGGLALDASGLRALVAAHRRLGRALGWMTVPTDASPIAAAAAAALLAASLALRWTLTPLAA